MEQSSHISNGDVITRRLLAEVIIIDNTVIGTEQWFRDRRIASGQVMWTFCY